MDKATWALVLGIVGVAVVALGVAVVSRGILTPPDLTTPEGVASAYILAIQNREPDKAWALLASPSAAAGALRAGPEGRNETMTQESFRQQVLNAYRSGNRRVGILGATTNGEAARVEIETTYVDSGFLGLGSGGNPQTRIFELKRSENGWRITAAPPIFDLA